MWSIRRGAIISESSARVAPPSANASNMSDCNSLPEVEMREDYDFSKGKRGKYAKRFARGSNVVVLEPDVARLYRDGDAVNRALAEVAPIRPRPRRGKS